MSVVTPEVRRRLDDGRSVLSEESSQTRRMLRLLLQGRLVFTPRDERRAVRFSGVGDFGQIFPGLIDSQALASPSIPSWNQMHAFLQEMRRLRESGISAA